MSAANPANHALLTIAAMGAKAVTECAPCIIFAHLSAEEIQEFRAALLAAEQSAFKVRGWLDDYLQAELSRSRENQPSLA